MVFGGAPERRTNQRHVTLQLLKDATESRRKCEVMKEQETQLKQQVSTGGTEESPCRPRWQVWR